VQFDAEREVWFILQDVFQQHVQREMQTTLRTLRRAEERLDEGESTHTADRVRQLRETYEDLQEIVRLAAALSPAELREALEQYDRQRVDSDD
jgi:DNA-binding transcriptional regulator GbsR (MarR family)